MKTYRAHLNEKLKNKRFRQLYAEEKQLAELSVRLFEIREQRRLTQKEVAQQAKVTQQQLSKLENGVSCNITTFLILLCQLRDSGPQGTVSQAIIKIEKIRVSRQYPVSPRHYGVRTEEWWLQGSYGFPINTVQMSMSPTI